MGAFMGGKMNDSPQDVTTHRALQRANDASTPYKVIE
jgi:hypothetical protein